MDEMLDLWKYLQDRFDPGAFERIEGIYKLLKAGPDVFRKLNIQDAGTQTGSTMRGPSGLSGSITTWSHAADRSTSASSVRLQKPDDRNSVRLPFISLIQGETDNEH